MTELEKQDLTIVVKELLRQAETQLNTTTLRETYDKIMGDIDNGPISPFKTHLMSVALQLLDVIASYEDRLHGIQEVVSYVQETPASDLDMEQIGPMLKKLLQP